MALPEAALSAAMFEDLAKWQANGPTAASDDLVDVLAAARPLMAGRFAWSTRVVGSGASGDPICRELCLMHVSGAMLTTVTWADPKADPFKVCGPALAGLLGLQIGGTDQQQPSDELDALIDQADAAAIAPTPVEPDEDLEAALSDSDAKTCLAMLKALPTDQRKSFTVAFRSHFEVPETVKAVGTCITQRKHQLFVQDFIDEIELQGAL